MPEKLVRDLIPQIIAETGVEPIMRVAGPHEYRALLELKLEEEADEYLRSGDPAELADLVEVARALAAELGEDVDRLAARKLAERGGFGQRLVWCGNREVGRG